MPETPVLASRLWKGGWYQFARPRPSPNFGPRPALAHIDLIVLHSISLPPGEYGGSGVLELFTNQLNWDSHPYFKTIEGLQVSAH
ncbi:MAG TPA: 1,6-anhydro-N-acetylmuramyl-L-alanine amidase AmpD, partial [Rhodoferax sp.]|nr:1,6-anhydro-N-acetylmuramyl-L-alanine amidase AmpD [Rhodoferax sp.]